MVNSIKLSILLSDFLRYKGLWEYRTYCKAFFINIYEMVNEINIYSNKNLKYSDKNWNSYKFSSSSHQ